MRLLMGCGRKYEPDYNVTQLPGKFTRLDVNPEVKPDLIANLDKLPYPFKDNTFSEIHAYEVMEHLGSQGDWKFYFAQFDELARITIDGGLFVFSSPKLTSEWLWGDPGHTRYFGPEALTFLDRDEYTRQQGKTAMTDYRFCFKSDWKILGGIKHPYSNIIVLKNKKEKSSGN